MYRTCITLSALLLFFLLFGKAYGECSGEGPTESNTPQILSKMSLIDGEDPVILGNTDGKVKIVIYSRPDCHYCTLAYQDIDLLKERDDLGIVVKHIPHDIESRAHLWARYVWSLNRQNNEAAEKFLKLAELKNKDLSEWDTFAEAEKINLGELYKDLYSEKAYEIIQENLAEAQALGVRGTPSYIIGEELIVGLRPAKVLLSYLP